MRRHLRLAVILKWFYLGAGLSFLGSIFFGAGWDRGDRLSFQAGGGVALARYRHPQAFFHQMSPAQGFWFARIHVDAASQIEAWKEWAVVPRWGVAQGDCYFSLP